MAIWLFLLRTNLSRNYALTEIVTRDKARTSGKVNLPRECAPAGSVLWMSSSFWREGKKKEIKVYVCVGSPVKFLSVSDGSAG